MVQRAVPGADSGRMWTARRIVVAALLAVAALHPASADAAAPARKASPLRVVGNKLVDSGGRVVQLRGVNRSSPETRCLGAGQESFFYGPLDTASVNAMRSWTANAVRIPVNEDCWLGRNGLPASKTAADYRGEIATYARLLIANGLNVIVDVHFAETSFAGVELASLESAPMLDKPHGVELWQSIVATFRNDPAVLFDLYNEPHDINWACWRDGCTDPLTGSQYVGMQELVTAVRAAGAQNPLILTGPSWGNDIGWWVDYKPYDPLGGLVAGVHVYENNGCSPLWCLEQRVRTTATVVPVVIGEMGALNCDGAFLDWLPDWADLYGISYLAFTWNVPNGMPCPTYHLINSFDGTPTPAGAVYRDHLLAVGGSGRVKATTAYVPLPL
jgi:hypothetical protein